MIDYKITRELFPILILFVGGINVAMDLQFFVGMCQSESNTVYSVYMGTCIS